MLPPPPDFLEKAHMTASWQAMSCTLAGRGVFINYRHGDVPGEAGRLFDRLRERFPGRVFRDIAGITPSENYVERIQHELSSCRAFVVLIGKGCLDGRESVGRLTRLLPPPARTPAQSVPAPRLPAPGNPATTSLARNSIRGCLVPEARS